MFDRRRLIAAVATLPVMGFAKPLSLQQVIARHVKARGGAAALDRIHSCRINVEIVERGQTLNGVYLADIGGLVRIDIVVGGQVVYREGVDAQGVWLWPQGEPAPKPSVADGAANALLHGAEGLLVGFHRFAERGHKLTLMPPETVDGVRHEVIEVIFKTGQTSYFYIDSRTWLVTRRRDRRAYHPDVDQTQQRVESRSLDYKRVGGVLSADRNEDYDLDTGQLLSTNRVTARVWNPQIAPGAFDRSFTGS